MNAKNNRRATRIAAGQLKTGDPRYFYRLSQPDPRIDVVIENDVRFAARDGEVLECDVYRPSIPGRFPVIVSLAPYVRTDPGSKMVGIEDRGGVGTALELFEQPNPEFWIPRGYVFVSVSPRGFSGSSGVPGATPLSQHEDFYDTVEWAAAQSWSTGAVGAAGISYYAMAQYGMAVLQPPHLRAIIPWEGLADPYRDIQYRGGMRTRFGMLFMAMLDRLKNGPAWRDSHLREFLKHPLIDDYWRARGAGMDLGRITVPMLSAGNLNDPDLHLRGNVEAFCAAGSEHKRLHLYSGTHWGSAYQPWALRTMLRFFDHWLKGVDTGITDDPAVDVELRTGPDSFRHVTGQAWHLPQTRWRRLHLDAAAGTLADTVPMRRTSARARRAWRGGRSNRIVFRTAPLSEDLAIAGPLTGRFWVSSTTREADISVEINDIDEHGQATLFAYYYHGSEDEPVTRGWLRASHRRLDEERTLPYRPFHLHTANDWLTPGEPVPLDIELRPTSMVFPAGHRVELIIHAGAHRRRGETGWLPGERLSRVRTAMYVFSSPKRNGRASIHTGPGHESWIQLSEIPDARADVQRIEVSEQGFTSNRCTAVVGEQLDVVNTGQDYRTCTESGPLRLWDTQLIRGYRSHNPETQTVQLGWAGTFTFRDEVDGATGTIAVAPRVDPMATDRVRIVFAQARPPAHAVIDVERREPHGPWTPVALQAGDKSIEVPAAEGRPVEYRSRIRSGTDPEAGAWSPPVRVPG